MNGPAAQPQPTDEAIRPEDFGAKPDAPAEPADIPTDAEHDAAMSARHDAYQAKRIGGAS